MRKHKYDIELGEHRDIIHYSVQALVAEEKVSSAELHLYEQYLDLHKNINVLIKNNLNHGSVLMSSDREQVEAWAAPLLEETTAQVESVALQVEQRGHINAGAHVSAEHVTQKAEAAALYPDELYDNLVVDHGDINRELHSKIIVAKYRKGQPQGTAIDHVAYHAVRSATSK